MAASSDIQLRVPGQIRFRPIAVRAIVEACRLVGDAPDLPLSKRGDTLDLTSPFDAEFVSAFSEIFNNIVLHAYGPGGAGDIDIRIRPSSDALLVELRDSGDAFDLASVPPPKLEPVPELEALPEGGMGIHIARSLLDEVEYRPGPPNLWKLAKRLRRAELALREA